MSAAKAEKKTKTKTKTSDKNKSKSGKKIKASSKAIAKTPAKKTPIKSAAKTTSKIKESNQAKGAKRGAKTRRQIKFFVSILSILVLNLTLNIVNKFIKWQTGAIDAYWLTAIGMVIVLIVFFPAIAMKYYVNIVTEWIWKHTINLSAFILQKRPAIFVVFFITLFILYVGFYWVWFDKFMFEDSFTKAFKFLKK